MLYCYQIHQTFSFFTFMITKGSSVGQTWSNVTYRKSNSDKEDTDYCHFYGCLHRKGNKYYMLIVECKLYTPTFDARF